MRQRPVRSGGSSRTDWMMWVVRSDEGGDGRTKMGMNPDRYKLRYNFFFQEGMEGMAARMD